MSVDKASLYEAESSHRLRKSASTLSLLNYKIHTLNKRLYMSSTIRDINICIFSLTCRPISNTWSELTIVLSLSDVTHRLVIRDTPNTRSPQWRATITSWTVLMPAKYKHVYMAFVTGSWASILGGGRGDMSQPIFWPSGIEYILSPPDFEFYIWNKF